jgi:hypothetical protein
LQLGIAWDGGAPPDAGQIESRVRMAVQLLTTTAKFSTESSASQRHLELATDLHDAGARCQELLPTVTATRRRRQRDLLPRFHEVEAAFLHHIKATLLNGDCTANYLQLSNMQNLLLDDLAVPPLQAHLLYEPLNKHTHEATKMLVT